MKTLIVALLTLFVAGAALIPEQADAKRFGGGRSLGKQFSMPRQAQPPRQASQQSGRQDQAGAATRQGAAQGAAGRSGASRWLGPLAGLAAGGLLASLFFGDAFQGFQIMDFLLIALLVFGGVMLFKTLRRNSAARGGPAPAVPYGRGPVGGGMPPMGGHAPPGGTVGDTAHSAAGLSPSADDVPYWFDGAGFVEGSKTHFIRLQAAWDRSDFRDIRDYTSPELFAELKRERESMGDAPNDTEVVTLNAELLGVRREEDRLVASIRFTGLIREEATGAANHLDEVWHVAHPWETPSGDWVIVGIQQAES
jgi:predicted lipid-binding transport protein (Tim44 family)